MMPSVVSEWRMQSAMVSVKLSATFNSFSFVDNVPDK
jgi:hypothetical protein